MTQHPTKSGSSISGKAGSNSPFPQNPVEFDGPQTVINPERRGALGDPASFHAAPGSSLWMRLFPNDFPSGGGSTEGPVGCRLAHFRIDATIGAGGMGAVFRAVDERLDRVVAVKVLSPNLSRDPASVQRFVNEARAAARLDHENIARVYFVGEDQGLHFIAHEFVTGRNVRDMIREAGPLEARDVVNYALQIAAALRHTSAAGVVHRDIKPSNVIVTPRGRAKLVDLGLAKKVTSESAGDLTMAGTTLGTFDYISPEQAKDPRNVDVRSDIYSLGCTLYHMLAGEPPYPEGTVLQKLLDHQAKDVPDASRKNPRTPLRLATIVRRTMAPDPRDRYASPDDLILDLLPLAAEMGLRGVNPEGLVWTSHAVGKRSFVESNVAWIAVVAALALFALLIDRFPVKSGTNGATAGRGAPPAAVSAETGKARSEHSKTTDSSDGTDRTIFSTIETGVPPVVGEHSSAPGARSIGSSELPANNSQSEKGPAATSIKSAVSPSNAKLVPYVIPSDPERPIFGDNSSAPAGDFSLPLPLVTRPEGKEKPAPVSERPPQAEPPPQFSITENDVTTPYATLEAAVADAKDGSIIELKFNGPRPTSEKPFRVSGKRITIRGGKGFRPVISFTARELAAAGTEDRMIALANASLELADVDIQATVPETSASDRWALFSIGGPDRLRWRGVNITVINPGNRPADVIDVATSHEQLADRVNGRPAGPMGSPSEFEIDIEHSFIRGSCDLMAVRTTETGRFDLRQSIVALQGPVIANWGDDDAPAESRRLAVRMEHVTCFLAGGLIQVDGGDVPRYLIPLDVTARNNIFASNSSSSLVALAGRSNDDSLRLIRWDATSARNFYDQFAAYWTIGPAGSPSRSPLTFDDWKRLLGDTEIDSNNGGILWKKPWQSKPLATVRNSDFELANVNHAKFGASDNTDVGADLAAIRAIPESPGGAEQPHPAPRANGS